MTHQAGEKHLESLRANYADASVDGELVAFIDDMARRYAEADLVICRAGAMTVAELAAGGMASVLVPFPHAVDDHQTRERALSLATRARRSCCRSTSSRRRSLATLLALARPQGAARDGAARRGRSASPTRRASSRTAAWRCAGAAA